MKILLKKSDELYIIVCIQFYDYGHLPGVNLLRILILTASTGGGDKRAAAALKDTIERNKPDTVVNVTDGIEYCGKLYNRLICSGYLVLATKTPKIYGKVYNISDNDTKLNALCNQINSREGRKLLSLFITFKPDVVISCHPFVTTMLCRRKRLPPARDDRALPPVRARFDRAVSIG